MRLVNNNISPLPFYDDIAKQHHRKPYAYGNVYNLIAYRNTLLPFQVLLPLEDVTPLNIWAYDKDGNVLVNFADYGEYPFDADMIAVDHVQCEHPYSVLRYNGGYCFDSLTPLINCTYYIAIELDNDDFGGSYFIYSDLITSVDDVSGYVHLRYKGRDGFTFKGGRISFANGFSFECYLDARIGKPQYDFEEEATERGGYTFIESQVSKKTYKFTFIAPEYLCDALRLVRLCEYKQIDFEGDVYRPSTFTINPKWLEQGDLASVDCEFETDTVISNIGGYMFEGHNDFNNDFNNDFD